ncbi:MAG: HD-GYP domain-containing protein [Rhodocyclaceae bacterium]|nr:HD-GYP domain-containing protein [Rhodocyclaceae bacterium]MDZ4214435.1 HD-GYP domain-containing protein [Rhodocyclaceae bacterium]
MLKKIAVTQLTLGMHIQEFCGSWMDHPFWRENFVLNAAADLKTIQTCGIKEVWIDIQKGVDVVGETKQEAEAEIDDVLEHIAPPKPVEVRVSMADEVKRAAKICAKSKEAVVSMFQEARMGKAVDHEAAGALVDEISNSVMRNPGALISLARLRSADDYTYMHSVAVCALMVALSRQLSLDDQATRAAGMAGLLHDLGKALMPMEVLNKPGKLTEEEFRIIKSHPVEGHRLLVEGGGAGEVSLDVCLYHHEKVDGSGYPKGLKGDEISLFAKMGAICDVYDAITSNRPYKDGWDPAESIRKMTEWSKGHFDERVFQAFVKSIGIYPTGSLVRLASGRLGVVIEQSQKSLLAPQVKVFFSTKSKAYIPPEIIDLSKQGAEKIVGREDAATWGLTDINRFWAQ